MRAMTGYITVMGCRRCGRCDSVCSYGALVRLHDTVRIDHEKCNACLRCVVMCPNKALKLIE
jgi:MinD superfamily P-loop ATPase